MTGTAFPPHLPPLLALAWVYGEHEGRFAHSGGSAGRFDRAVPVCLRRIEISRQLGRSCGKALALGVLGDAYAGLGRYEEAADSLLRALPIFRDHGVTRLHGLCLLKLGQVQEGIGPFTEAIGYLEESQVIFQQLRLPRKTELARQAIDRCRAAAPSEGNR